MQKIEEKEGSDPDAPIIKLLSCECGSKFKTTGKGYNKAKNHTCLPTKKKQLKNLKKKNKAALKEVDAEAVDAEASKDVVATKKEQLKDLKKKNKAALKEVAGEAVDAEASKDVVATKKEQLKNLKKKNKAALKKAAGED